MPVRGDVSLEPGAVRDSQECWRAVRAELNANRVLLGDLVSDRYPQGERVAGTKVLAAPGWVPDAPVDLADVELSWRRVRPACSSQPSDGR